MTISRVELEDEAVVVKAIKKEEPEVLKYFTAHQKDYDKLYDGFSKWVEAGLKQEKECNKILADSRKGYTLADKKLKELEKDKSGNREKIQQMLKIRKYFYDTGNEAKSMADTCRPY